MPVPAVGDPKESGVESEKSIENVRSAERLPPPITPVPATTCRESGTYPLIVSVAPVTLVIRPLLFTVNTGITALLP